MTKWALVNTRGVRRDMIDSLGEGARHVQLSDPAMLPIAEAIPVDTADANADAINADFGHRAAEESKLLELFNCVDGIRSAKKSLGKWMKPQHRHVGILFATAKNRLIPQPKGVIGLVSPWN